MKVLTLGVVRMSGTSMKSGSPKPYDMTRITYAVAVQPVESDKRQLMGYGYETRDVDLDPAALPQFKDVKFPAVLDLDVQVDPANLRRNVCVGCKVPA